MTQNAFIPLMVPDIQQQDIDAVVEVLKSGMLIQGKKVAQLESEIAIFIGVKHAIAVSNGTATLHLALIANGIGAGDEVIVPALSYIATANVVELVGAKPIFVDVDLATFNMDVNQIEKAITPRTKAIMPVHEFGLCCDIESIVQLADKHNLIVIEDAACALGAKVKDQFAGTFGNVGSFSFHPRKAITSGEGGMLVTNDDALAKRFRTLRNHGMDPSQTGMNFIEAGYNYRLTDIQAALVLSQLQRLPEILSSKRQLATVYFDELKGNQKMQLPEVPKDYLHTWQSFHVVLADEIDRNKCIETMRENGVGVNLGAQCMPNETYFKQKYKLDCENLFPNAMKANKQGLVLPLYEKLNESQIKEISEVITRILI